MSLDSTQLDEWKLAYSRLGTLIGECEQRKKLSGETFYRTSYKSTRELVLIAEILLAISRSKPQGGQPR